MRLRKDNKNKLMAMLAIGLFIVFDIAGLSLNYLLSLRIEQQAVGINLAGRQRMLSQRMVKTLLQIDNARKSGEDSKTYLDELKLTFDLFDNTLRGFDVGNETRGGAGEKLFLPPVTEVKARKAVNEAVEIWKDYRTKVVALLSTGNELGSTALQSALIEATARNLKLLGLMNTLTTELETLTQHEAQRIRIYQTLALLFAIVCFVSAFILFRRRDVEIMNANRLGQEYAATLEKSGQNREQLAHLSLCLQQATCTAELGQFFLTETHRILGMLQGVIYAVDDGDEQSLQLIASYACAETPPVEIKLGAGLLGQCALDQRSQVIETESRVVFAIRSGLGETFPAAVMMTPLLLNNRLLGVIEIALLAVPGQLECEQFEEMSKLLAINLEIVGRAERTEAALAAAKDTELKLERLDDAERFNRLAQDREQRILELKGEVNKLSKDAGQPVPYATTLIETVGEHQVDLHPDYRPGDHKADEKPLELVDLVDLSELQKLFSSFCDSIGIAAAIIDLEGKVLVSSRWQRACTDFHRVNPESCARCIESDTELALKLKDGTDFTMYRCKNGMTDCASPIILERRHLANVFIGQFHIGTPDLAFFAEQARLFSYPEADYLKAVNEAPVMDEQRLPTILGFLTGFARMVTTMALARRRADEAQTGLERQAQLLRSERVAAMSLAEDAERARRELETQSKEPNI